MIFVCIIYPLSYILNESETSEILGTCNLTSILFCSACRLICKKETTKKASMSK
ncbi:unnamed protein product [Moneuplotes crassus]|uniref:Uncharacterized protein n=1 Tax=Euplotes crassus TaxID=5936 RepID=A0AAD1XS90_EUPCR|nr:unnamed protein product [Moneuplotes crassus]